MWFLAMILILYMENIHGGKLPHFERKLAIHVKTFAVEFGRLIMLIDKDMIHRKRFVIE